MSQTSFFSTIRSLGVERAADAPIGGVSAGLARKWNVDPLLVRAGFLALTFAGGAGAMLYALCWAFLPEEFTGEIHAQELTRGRLPGGFVAAAALLIVAIAVFTGLSFTSTLGLIIAIVIGVVCYNSFRKNGPDSGPIVFDDDGEASPPTSTPYNPDQPRASGEPLDGGTVTLPVAPDGRTHSETSDGSTPSQQPSQQQSSQQQAEGAPSPKGAWDPHPEDPHIRHERQRKEREREEARKRKEATRARRRLSGRALSGLLAVVLLLIAGFLLTLEGTDASAHQLPATIAFTSLAFGAVVLVIGIFGRRGGILSFFAIVAMLCAAPIMLINTQTYSNSSSLRYQMWKPASIEQVGTGYSSTMGSAYINLSELDSPTDSDPINVSASMSNVDLRFTEGQKVAIIADITMSDLDVDRPYRADVDANDANAIYFETDPEWEEIASEAAEDEDWDEDWDEQWRAHSNAYIMSNPLQGNDSGTVFLGGINKVSDADIVINLQASMSTINIKQLAEGYPTPEPSPTQGE
ncbi:PspC domain-containing protein [Ancrocorticia sp.]|uniref:PspC domain-containing protein n=1 Tax=Ancrocorticia sp. TaxID=2593684 RepID=UPI003F938DD3